MAQLELHDKCLCLNCMHDPMAVMVERNESKTKRRTDMPSNPARGGAEIMYDKCPTVTASAGMSGNNQPVICLATFEGNGSRPSHHGSGMQVGGVQMYTLNSTEVHGVITERRAMNLVRKDGTVAKPEDEDYQEQVERFDKENDPEVEYDVRRLTPIECARLQGFPPDWCADVPHSDSAEYKLWGNGIALPSILPMMQNAVKYVEELKDGRTT